MEAVGTVLDDGDVAEVDAAETVEAVEATPKRTRRRRVDADSDGAVPRPPVRRQRRKPVAPEGPPSPLLAAAAAVEAAATGADRPKQATRRRRVTVDDGPAETPTAVEDAVVEKPAPRRGTTAKPIEEGEPASGGGARARAGAPRRRRRPTVSRRSRSPGGELPRRSRPTTGRPPRRRPPRAGAPRRRRRLRVSRRSRSPGGELPRRSRPTTGRPPRRRPPRAGAPRRGSALRLTRPCRRTSRPPSGGPRRRRSKRPSSSPRSRRLAGARRRGKRSMPPPRASSGRLLPMPRRGPHRPGARTPTATPPGTSGNPPRAGAPSSCPCRPTEASGRRYLRRAPSGYAASTCAGNDIDLYRVCIQDTQDKMMTLFCDLCTHLNQIENGILIEVINQFKLLNETIARLINGDLLYILYRYKGICYLTKHTLEKALTSQNSECKFEKNLSLLTKTIKKTTNELTNTNKHTVRYHDITIIGGSLCEIVLAIYLKKKFSFNVHVYDKLDNPRVKYTEHSSASFNITLSSRGLIVLSDIGLQDSVREIGIPVYGRCFHTDENDLIDQLYGPHNEALYAVKRDELLCLLISEAEKEGIILYYGMECDAITYSDGPTIIHVIEKLSKRSIEIHTNYLFGTDGLNSKVRETIDKHISPRWGF